MLNSYVNLTVDNNTTSKQNQASLKKMGWLDFSIICATVSVRKNGPKENVRLMQAEKSWQSLGKVAKRPAFTPGSSWRQPAQFEPTGCQSPGAPDQPQGGTW